MALWVPEVWVLKHSKNMRRLKSDMTQEQEQQQQLLLFLKPAFYLRKAGKNCRLSHVISFPWKRRP